MATITPGQAKIIKATVPVLAAHGNTITKLFYADLLRAHPELKNVFNHTHQVTGHQSQALAAALYAYASNIDDLGVLSPALELICQKHASLYIKPDQYEAVGTHLLATMKVVLGDALTPQIHDAWAAAYWQLAHIMINREQQLYDEADSWTDWRQFRIARKEAESAEITSFYLEPVDKKPLPTFKPGQYISIRTAVPALGSLQARQYSLSDAPRAEYYRISVKREAGLNMDDPQQAAQHPGYISNILHTERLVGDELSVSHPYGDFFLDSTAGTTAAPVVLISAGVGLTCLTAILNALVAQQDALRRPVAWIHAARDSSARAFATHVAGVVRENANVHAVHHVGRMNLDKLDKERDLFLGDGATEFYICGPTQFMLDMEARLKEYGVGPDRIKMELFGTGGVPRV